MLRAVHRLVHDVLLYNLNLGKKKSHASCTFGHFGSRYPGLGGNPTTGAAESIMHGNSLILSPLDFKKPKSNCLLNAVAPYGYLSKTVWIFGIIFINSLALNYVFILQI